MADELTLAVDAQADQSGAGAEEVDLQKSWDDLLASDGNLPEDEAPPAEETPGDDAPAGETETTAEAKADAPSALDPRLAKLEEEGSAALARMQAAKGPGEGAPPPVEKPPAPPPADIAPLRSELDQLKAQNAKTADLLAVAALAPEVIRIEADPQHPFREFYAKLTPGLRFKYDYGTPNDAAQIINVFQEQRLAASNAQIDAQKGEALARKNALHKAPAGSGGAPDAPPRMMTDEDYARLPEREKERLWLLTASQRR